MEKTKSLYHGHRFPAVVISCVIRWYFRFSLSLCVFRTNVTGRFGMVTVDFGNVTGQFGNVTERTGRQDWRCA